MSPSVFTCRRSTEESTIAHGAADGALLAHDVPGLERLAQLQLDAAIFHLAAEREAELLLRLEPFGVEGEAVLAQVVEHVEEVLPDDTRAA